MQKNLITLHTRTPLHVGCGTSVDVVDLPITRERISNFPVIPSSGLKGVLRDASRHHFGKAGESKTRLLFGEDRKLNNDASKGEVIEAHAGCIQIIEAKLLAFPVRSLKGCFAWITCPSALLRFQRDTGRSFDIPAITTDHAIAGPDLVADGIIVLEEYALRTVPGSLDVVVGALKSLTDDALWQQHLAGRLALVSDEDFQHFVTACTEVVQRIVINPATRIVDNLFSQENVPCETLFYAALTILPTRQANPEDLSADLAALLNASSVIQIGGDETTGHGFCTLKSFVL